MSSKLKTDRVWNIFASVAELCPEHHCIGHNPHNYIWVLKCKLYTLVVLENYYWWIEASIYSQLFVPDAYFEYKSLAHAT
jgi:hypothetical protein